MVQMMNMVVHMVSLGFQRMVMGSLKEESAAKIGSDSVDQQDVRWGSVDLPEGAVEVREVLVQLRCG